MRILLLGLSGTLLASASLIGADPAPKVRQICDPLLPENAEVCIPDTFEVTFGADKSSGDSVLAYTDFAPETEIEVLIVTDTKSPRKVQGWSFGVEHDPAYLTILDATAGGTDADPFLLRCWVITTLDVDKCPEGDDWCGPPHRKEGAGFLTATAMCFKGPTLDLPVKRNSLCRAKYRLVKDAGCEGTVIGVTDRLAPPGSPPSDINITIDGRHKRWTEAVDGWIVKHCGEPLEAAFRRADVDGNGRHNLLDVISGLKIFLGTLQPRFDCRDLLDANDDGTLNLVDVLPILNWLFRDGPDLPSPFRECGLDPTPDALSCQESNCP